MSVRLVLLSLVSASLLLVSGCASSPSPEPSTAAALRPIEVAAVTVDIGVGSPIPVEIVASGDWPDLCAQLALMTSNIDGNNINVSLLATEADLDCPPDFVGVPFRIAVPLNPVELPHTTYTITVNGVSTTFAWPQP
jgi:hypothetical protein